MKIQNKIAVLMLILLVNSCFKEDIQLAKPKPGDVKTVTIEIGYPYLNQVYYNCEKNLIVSSNSRYDWDLKFENGINGYHIIVNTAKGILVSNQGNVNFADINSATGVNWQWDKSNGNLDSTAIGEWYDFDTDMSKQMVYIIDLQSDESGNDLGYKKITFDNVDANSYSFSYANLDGSQYQSYTIQKDDALNFVSFSFANGGETVSIEPPKNDWDLCFTNYQHFFSNLPLPFVVTGVLSNKYSGIKIAEDNENRFSAIQLSDTLMYYFTDEQDEIGYDWKIRNSADNSFTIDENKSYILKNQIGLYYKIRFIDFYNSTGSKGYPKFEIQKL